RSDGCSALPSGGRTCSRASGAHVLAASRGDGRGASGGGGEGRAPRPLPGVGRVVSWRGWFGCPSRMRPLALSGLRLVARVSEAHPGSLLLLGGRTCSRARRACPRMPLPVEMAEARAGGRKGGTGAEDVAGRSEVGVL